MKILHIIASADLSEGGPIEHAVRIGDIFARDGHQQDFATLDPPGFPAHADIPAIVHALGDDPSAGSGPVARLRRKLRYAPRAVPWLREHARDYDIVIVSGLWNYATMAARRALVGGDTPYVVFTHGMLDPWFRRAYPVKGLVKQVIWPFNEAKLLRHAAKVLFTCEEERQLARQSFSPYRADEQVVAFGTADVPDDADAQIAAFRAAFPALGDRRYLLFLSRIHRKKGVDLLIDAFGQVAERFPDVDLVIAGPDQEGLKETLQARAHALGLDGRVHWPGMVKGDVKWGAFRACDGFVLPSHQENFGIVVAEAMACSRPLIISDKVNIWREIAEDGAGFVASDTVEGTVESLVGLLSLSHEERAAMGERGRQSFLKRFRIESAVQDLMGVFERALARR